MIKAENLTRKYGVVTAVDSLSFEIGQNEIVGLLGHNGAGKTTVMKMITGYLEPTAGLITVDGADAWLDRLSIQRQIGYLPENCPLYPEMTVLDYLEYAAALRGVPDDQKMQRIAYAVRKTKLLSVGEKQVSTLSRGYKQRLGVAQAILNSPKILILDEPTNGLDPSQILEMRSLIKELAQSATIIVSTHILQEVQAVCDRVIIIASGKLALDAKIASLQKTEQIQVVADREPSKCQAIFAKNGRFSVLSHKANGDKHTFVLEAKNQDASGLVPALAKALVEGGVSLYAIQPVARDLETVFGEISAGLNVAGQPAAGSAAQSKADAMAGSSSKSESAGENGKSETSGSAASRVDADQPDTKVAESEDKVAEGSDAID